MGVRNTIGLRIDPLLFLRFLGLPDDIKIIGWRGDYDGSITLGIEHDSLPPLPEGSVMPIADLTIWRDEDAADSLVRLARFSAAWSFAPDKRWPIKLVELIPPATA